MDIQAKQVSNVVKIISVLIAIIFNVVYLVMYGKIATMDEQKSLMILCGFVVLIFMPIDLSILVKNILQKKAETINEVQK